MTTNILNRKSFSITTSALLVAMLAGCGGGGGGESSTPTPVRPPPAPATANLVTSVPAANYTGEFAVAYNLLNAERNHCGFGLLAQNAAIDAMAMAHANYTFIAGDSAHFETVGRPGFTGVTIEDRATFQGYANGQSSTSEVMAVGNGAMPVRGLLSAPYHLMAMLRGYRDVGIGLGRGYDPQAGIFTNFVMNMGYPLALGEQMIGANDVTTYPCEGSTGVNRMLTGETPNPVPGRDLRANPIGTPIAIRVRTGNVLEITSASMVNMANGISVPMRDPILAKNDPNASGLAGYFTHNEGYVAPDVPLVSNTKYQVTVTGTNNGTPFSRTFSFTTGSVF